MPIAAILIAGGLCLMGRLATVSWPLAGLMAWSLVRAFWNGAPVDAISLKANVVVMEASRVRPFQILMLLALAAMLYVAARHLPRSASLRLGSLHAVVDPVRCAAWALCAGVLYEGLFGYLNLWGLYPWMSFIQADQVGRPMGFLTHPNYWGSFVALGVPIVWSLCGVLPALALALMIVASYSATPVVAVACGIVLLAWPHLSRRWRYGFVGAAASVVTAVITVHEWRLSGRWENWAAAWPELMRYPVIGQGLGSWRIWADHTNTKLSMQTGQPSIFATLQAHNEVYQLWFELGLIGLFLVALWGLQAGLAAWVTWTADDRGDALLRSASPRWYAPGFIPLERAWVAVLVIGLVNSLGSPVFHLPGQGAIVLFALACCQAEAARILERHRDGESTFYWRTSAPSERDRRPKRRRPDPTPMEVFR